MKKIIASTIFSLFFSLPIFSIDNVGQRFILSLPENTEDQIKKWLSEAKPAGIMLTAAHFKNRDDTKKLISFIQQEAKNLNLPPLFIAVDWEGGIVSRPNEEGNFISTPCPWLLAQAGRFSCFLAGFLIGTQLKSIGVNMDFAPSLDLFDSNNLILATRCFSENPQKTAACGIAFAKGLLSQNVLPVIKHFPGLGLGKKDTHFSSEEITADQKTFEKHTYPFKQALNKDIPCIMFSHATYQQFGKIPTTLSSNAINYINEKNENIIFITDDFSMQAVQKDQMLEDAVIKSLNAGYHLIIFSGSPQKQLALIKNIEKKMLQYSEDEQKLFNKKINQIIQFKEKFLTKTKSTTQIDEKSLAEFLIKKCIKKDKHYPSISNKKIVLFSTDLTKIRTTEDWFIDKQTNKSYLHTLLKEKTDQIEEYIFNPLDKNCIKNLQEILSSYLKEDKIEFVIQTFFYSNGAWNTIQNECLNLFQPLQDRLLIISLGHPWEGNILPHANIFNIGSFHKPILHQAVHLLSTKPQLTGADVFASNLSQYIKGKKFGLLCNNASKVNIKNKIEFLPDVIYKFSKSQAEGSKLFALFCPEHGLLGNQEAGAKVNSNENTQWDCPLYSLHGTNKKPTEKMLEGLDLIIIDLQEVGVRCFTYLSTMKYMLEAAKKANIPVIVLDRPNPLIEWKTSGPMLEKDFKSFLGELDIPFIHGSSIGALAKQANKEIGCSLKVVECKNCNKNFFLETTFTPPSPNLQTLDHIFAYPITVFIEGTNYSEGRGTEYPFLQIGAPWVQAEQLAQELNQKNLPGVYFEPISFVPKTIKGVAEKPKHHNKTCNGVFINIFNHETIKPDLTALTILETLFTLYPEQSQLLTSGKKFNLDFLVGNDTWSKKLQKTSISIKI